MEEEINLTDSIYLGNIYGLHDGYDGSVFSIYGICKTITASKGGIADILVKDSYEDGKVSGRSTDSKCTEI